MGFVPHPRVPASIPCMPEAACSVRHACLVTQAPCFGSAAFFPVFHIWRLPTLRLQRVLSVPYLVGPVHKLAIVDGPVPILLAVVRQAAVVHAVDMASGGLQGYVVPPHYMQSLLGYEAIMSLHGLATFGESLVASTVWDSRGGSWVLLHTRTGPWTWCPTWRVVPTRLPRLQCIPLNVCFSEDGDTLAVATSNPGWALMDTVSGAVLAEHDLPGTVDVCAHGGDWVVTAGNGPFPLHLNPAPVGTIHRLLSVPGVGMAVFTRHAMRLYCCSDERRMHALSPSRHTWMAACTG